MNRQQDFTAALDELSTAAPRTDHADRALRTATRRSRIRAAAAASTTAAGAAVVVLAATTLHGPSPAAPAAPPGSLRPTTSGTPAPAHTDHTPLPGPTNSPGVLAASGSTALLSYNLHSADLSDPWYAWDTETHKYVRTDAWVRPSPDARYGLIFDDERMAVASWADAVHKRNLHWTPVSGPTKWSASGNLITVDARKHTITWTDPATGDKSPVPWPAQLRNPAQVMYGFGGLADDQVMLWSYAKNKRTTTTVWTVNRSGRLTSSVVITGVPVPRPFFDMVDPAAGPLEPGELNARAMWSGEPSPDGKYINTREAIVLNVAEARVAFRFNVPGGYQPMPAGWLPNGNVAIFIGNDIATGGPMRLDIFDVGGHKVGSIPIKTIPAYGPEGFSLAMDLAVLGS